MTIQLRNVVQCPACGFKTTEQMPQQQKVMHYQCPACQAVTHALAAECCIYCKLGRLQCPERQAAGS